MNTVCKPLLLLIFLVPCLVFGQEYSYTHYDSKEGLAGSTVYYIQQDHEGFLWFGTETGLSRFDGTHFTNFTTTDGLPDNEILKLFVDSKNRVWAIPFRNSICYYSKGRIYNTTNDSVLKKIRISAEVKSVLEDKRGNILIVEQFLLHIIKSNGNIITMRTMDNELFQIYDANVNEQGSFRVAVGLEHLGPMFVDIDADRETVIKTTNKFFPEGTINWFLLRRDLVAVRNQDSLLFLSQTHGRVNSLPVPENFINVARINDSLFVINAASKCILYSLNPNRMIGEFLDGHKVTAVLEDREKNLWFATMGEGVFRLGSTAFRDIKFNDDESPLSVFSILKVDSSIYIGTDHSLLWQLSRTGEVVHKHKISTNSQHVRVLSLAQDINGRLLIGSDWGIHTLKGSLPGIEYPLAVKSIVSEKGVLYFGTAGGGFVLDVQHGQKVATQLWRKRITCMFPHGDNYYLGMLTGLYEINAQGKAVMLGETNSLLGNRISAITKTDDGVYWIATYGEGVVGLKNNKVIMHLNQDNGLTSNICRNIFVSGNVLWVGTDKGLNKVTLYNDKYDILKLTTADGLGSDIINAVYVDGPIIYVGTPQGVTYFNENNISQTSDCDLRITAIKSSDKVWNYDTTGFLLPHRDNNIRLEFVGISYRSVGHINYRYRLMGLDSNWKTTSETFLSYPSLPSGKYTLQLAAINKFGVQSETKQIHFSIEQLLEERTWFRILLFLLGGTFVWLAVIIYIKRIREKEARKGDTVKKMTELEQKALKAQMNPHFIFNSLNSIQQYVMEKDTIGANKFITAFSSLIRQTLDFSTRQEITIQEELQYLATYLELEKTRMEEKFIYCIQVSDTVSPGEYCIPPMVLQPYVENSIRHGISYRRDKEGKIVINVRLENNKLICTVEDNGVGRLVAGQFKMRESFDRQSRGMSVTADRIEMMNKNTRHKIELMVQDLIDQNNEPLGTRVTVSFPV
jgi:ligand-binding sensor domain-containing protein